MNDYQELKNNDKKHVGFSTNNDFQEIQDSQIYKEITFTEKQDQNKNFHDMRKKSILKTHNSGEHHVEQQNKHVKFDSKPTIHNVKSYKKYYAPKRCKCFHCEIIQFFQENSIIFIHQRFQKIFYSNLFIVNQTLKFVYKLFYVLIILFQKNILTTIGIIFWIHFNTKFQNKLQQKLQKPQRLNKTSNNQIHLKQISQIYKYQMNFLEAMWIFYFFWALYFIIITKDWFGKRFAYLKDPIYLNNQDISGFIRYDRKNWNLFEFYCVGVFITPIRIVTIILLLFLSKNICRFIQFLMNIHFKEIDMNILPRKFHKISQFIMSKTIRMVLFFMGYFYFENVEVKFDESKYPKLKKVCHISQWKKPFLILQNHVATSDIFWNLYEGNRCFLSKESIKKYPIIGYYNQILQSILVNRSDSKDREKVMSLLKNRIEKMNQNQKYNSLVIFAEGTTHNQETLLPFKKGIFSLNYPIKIEALKYQGTIDNSLSMMNLIENFLSICFNFKNKCTRYDLDCLIEPACEMTSEEYAEEVRTMMCKEFNFKKGKGSFSDKAKFFEKLTGRKYKS